MYLQITLAALTESQTPINFDMIMKVNASIKASPSAILNWRFGKSTSLHPWDWALYEDLGRSGVKYVNTQMRQPHIDCLTWEVFSHIYNFWCISQIQKSYEYTKFGRLPLVSIPQFHKEASPHLANQSSLIKDTNLEQHSNFRKK